MRPAHACVLQVRHYPEYVDLLLAMRECVDPATGKYVAPPPPSHDHDDHGHGSAAAPAPALAIEAPASAGAAAAPAAAAQPSAAGTGIAASAGHHPVGGRAHTVIPAGGSAAGAAAGAPGAAAAAPGGSTNWASGWLNDGWRERGGGQRAASLRCLADERGRRRTGCLLLRLWAGGSNIVSNYQSSSSSSIANHNPRQQCG